MSLTGLLWLALFAWLTFASMRRPVYASLCHLMTFFASPVFWWFGGGILTTLTVRWSLVAVLILMVANAIHWQTHPPFTILQKRFVWLLALVSLNALLVHSLLANYPPESAKVFDILWKGCLATVLILLALRNKDDLDLFLFGIVSGCAFVGYQVVLSEQGSMQGGRLEGIYFPGAQGANGTAAVLSMGLVLSAYFFISGRSKVYMWTSLLFSPLILDSILRCNSRGSYLGLIASGMVLVAFARGEIRKRAIFACLVGACALLFLAKSDQIWERFQSIFVEAEERDGSAAERLLYWQAAIKMIGDYPFGSGGEAAFTSPRGVSYIAHFRPEFRSVHNGPLDIAAGWGIQGIVLLGTVLVGAVVAAHRGSRVYLLQEDTNQAFLGSILMATIAGQLVCSMFTSVLDGEWFLWLAACGLVYAREAEVGDAEATSAEYEVVV